ncbi:MAG: hypothetical protein ACRDPY_45270, partial [Streptosporangiaceae bacterium]
MGVGEEDGADEGDADGEREADGDGVPRWIGDVLAGGATVGCGAPTVGWPPDVGVGTGDGESPGESSLLAVAAALADGALLVRAVSAPAEFECEKVIAAHAATADNKTTTTAAAAPRWLMIMLHTGFRPPSAGWPRWPPRRWPRPPPGVTGGSTSVGCAPDSGPGGRAALG